MIKQLLRWFLWLPPPTPLPTPRKTFWDEAREIEPGQVMIATDRRDGSQYALMHLDDFDHIAGLGKLIRRDLAPDKPSRTFPCA